MKAIDRNCKIHTTGKSRSTTTRVHPWRATTENKTTAACSVRSLVIHRLARFTAPLVAHHVHEDREDSRISFGPREKGKVLLLYKAVRVEPFKRAAYHEQMDGAAFGE